MKTRYLTAESVCKGHPDKLCDLIADGILDVCLKPAISNNINCIINNKYLRLYAQGNKKKVVK